MKIEDIDFEKSNGLVPVVVQHFNTLQVLMLGYMNEEALQKTLTDGKVCFFSRSKNRLWVKGETSGNHLLLRSISHDCDNDALLVHVEPIGPTCHTGSTSCFKDSYNRFIYPLESIIQDRIMQVNNEHNSYTRSLMNKGIKKIAQKVGEEAVELALEAENGDTNDFLNESADLLFHYMLLLQAKGCSLSHVEEILIKRHNQTK